MPLKRCEANGVEGWKCGDSGKCYTGADAKKKAIDQCIAEGEQPSVQAAARKESLSPAAFARELAATQERILGLEDRLAHAAEKVFRQAGKAAARRFRENVTSLTAAAPTPDSAMVAVYPTAEQADALAQPNGEPPEILHVTLAFLGQLDPDQAAAAVAVAERVAADHQPLEGVVGGTGTFHAEPPKDGQEPLYPAIALPDVPGLAELRQAVCEALSAAGIDYAENHGWTPHLTLAYESSPVPPPSSVHTLPLSFDCLVVARGDVRVDVPLGQSALTAAAGWVPPHPDEIVDVPAIVSALHTKMDPIRQSAIEEYGGPLKGIVDWNVTNPLAAGVLAGSGQHVTNIADTTRLNVMRTIGESYEQGLSIPDTAKAIREGMAAAAPARGRLIARTELAAVANGGALAASQAYTDATGEALYKRWMTAPGAEYPRHELVEGLDGQTVALNDLFDVQGEPLSFPGDPNGSPENICNCLAAGTEVELPGLRFAMRRWYEGDLVRLSFSGGGYLTVTPNHPILRADGEWAAASELDEGDYCIGGSFSREPQTEPDVKRMPADVGEVYRTANATREPKRVSIRPDDFHGDGRDGEVEVIAADRHLRDDREAASDKQLFEFGLALADEARARFRRSPGDTVIARSPGALDAERLTSPRRVSGSGKATPLILGRARHSDVHRGAPISTVDPLPCEATPDDATANAEPTRERLLALPVDIALYEIVDVEVYPSRGWVYNFDTGQGWYLSGNGIRVVTGNCRCALAFVGSPDEQVGAATDALAEPLSSPDSSDIQAAVPATEAAIEAAASEGMKAILQDGYLLQARLRSGDLAPVANYLRAIDTAIGGSTLRDGAVSLRGLDDIYAPFQGKAPKVGDIGYDPAYASTTLRPATADVHTGVDTTGGYLTYHVAPGQNGLWVPGAFPGFVGDQSELLLPRGLPLRVIGIERYNGKPNIHVEIVGRPVTPGAPGFAGLAQVEFEPIVGDTAYALAGPVVRNAARAEAKVTAAIRAAVEPRGGHLEGLPYRIKSAPSIGRKIDLVSNDAQVPVQAAATAIKDGLRYTAVYDPAVYVREMEATLADLRQAGIVVERGRAKWAPGIDYAGTNLVMRAPNGFRFELQFHTPESYNVKEHVNVELYHRYRRLDPWTPEAMKLRTQMVANTDKVARPPGIERWRVKESVEGDIGITPFREGADDPIGFYDSAKFQKFEQDVRGFADRYGVTIDEEARATGVWMGEEEPSVTLRVHDGEAGVNAYAADLGRAYEQDGVAIFHPSIDEDVIVTYQPAPGTTFDRDKVHAAMERAGLPAGRFTADGSLEIMGSGPAIVAQLDALGQDLGVSYSWRVGRFTLLEGNDGYESAIENFGRVEGEPVRPPSGPGELGSPAAPRPSPEGAEAGAPPPAVAGLPKSPAAAASGTLPAAPRPAIPSFTDQQIRLMSTNRLWHEHGYLGKIENLARAEVASEQDAPLVKALWERADKGLRKGTVRYGDLTGDRQLHTWYSDGHESIREMADEAIKRGQSEMVVSDHSHLLTPTEVDDQIAEIDNVNEALAGKFHILKGIEANVLADGSLDVTPELAARFDFVNAAIHAPEGPGGQLSLLPESNTDRMLKALDNPSVSVLVHPHSVDADWDAVAAKAADRHIPLEINGRDLLRNDREQAAAAMIAAGKRYGAKFVIGSDAHTSADMVDALYAVRFAARQGVTLDDIAPIQKRISETTARGINARLIAPDPANMPNHYAHEETDVAKRFLGTDLPRPSALPSNFLNAPENARFAKKEIMEKLAARLDENPDWLAALNPEALRDADIDVYSEALITDWPVEPEVSFGATESQKRVAGLVSNWATTAADDHPWALAMQKAIADEFKLPVPEFLQNREGWEHALEIDRYNGKALRAFARAMYDETQERLAAAGIDNVLLYRGQGLEGHQLEGLIGRADSGTVKEAIQLQPASSFSSSYRTSMYFTRTPPAIIAVRVPRERILGTVRTGFGALGESEFVVLGEPAGVEDEAWIWSKKAEGWGKPQGNEFWLNAQKADAAPNKKFLKGIADLKPGDMAFHDDILAGSVIEYEGKLWHVGTGGGLYKPGSLAPSYSFRELHKAGVNYFKFVSSAADFAIPAHFLPAGTKFMYTDPVFTEPGQWNVWEIQPTSEWPGNPIPTKVVQSPNPVHGPLTVAPDTPVWLAPDEPSNPGQFHDIPE